MFRLILGLVCAAALFSPACALAQPAPQAFFSVPPSDAPELAPRGPFKVGVRMLQLVHHEQPDILNFNKETGQAPLYARPLTVEIWYPASVPDGVEELTTYTSVFPGSGPLRAYDIAGKARRDAIPVAGQKFPLVIVSHGYPGSRVFLSYLTENLASKGYVVAAIDHTDSVVGAVKPFPSTLLNRSSDQLFTLQELVERSRRPDDPLSGLIDPASAAVIGYSMGGFGALASAGAPYSPQGAAAKLVPGGYFPKHPSPVPANLKAVVAIAPWGAQPPINSWTAEGLAGIRIPSFFIVGDQDDVSGFSPGVKTAFDLAVNSERCMLVFQNARHNVGGNPPPPGVPLPYSARESFDEPVWRKDRITAINQHFITAFLDLYLKGDQSRRPYLHPALEKSNDGKWPLPAGQSSGAAFSKGDESQTVWKGFQRRWAVGLEMHCSDPR